MQRVLPVAASALLAPQRRAQLEAGSKTSSVPSSSYERIASGMRMYAGSERRLPLEYASFTSAFVSVRPVAAMARRILMRMSSATTEE